MPKALLFWLIFAIWIVVYIWLGWPFGPRTASDGVLALLIGILGWGIFGKPVQ